MKTRDYDDGDNEVVEVPLRMQKRNFDALVKAHEDGKAVPVSGISFLYDDGMAVPYVRLIASSGADQKEEQQAMGFYGVSFQEGE